ncbi:MAG: DUF2851 family protein [Chloroflexi bacterium]|nr:DUF2851 family protein [Chloroflexota bacterium]
MRGPIRRPKRRGLESRMTEPTSGELELQRRWAESRWPTPFLHSGSLGSVRVISPGRWNRGPGPDFRDAQILDASGRARRGNVELHLEASAWIQHGHADDPAYQDILLHVVDWAAQGGHAGRTRDERVPAAIPLPEPLGTAVTGLPCDDIVSRAGLAAVNERLRQIAERRFLRKSTELRALNVPRGPGAPDDRRSLLAAARALGQPFNSAAASGAVRAALEEADRWDDVSLRIDTASWRRGRGALGSSDGLTEILTTLLQRWTMGGSAPWRAFSELSDLPLPAATDHLRIAGRLGRARAVQLLADAVYPLTGAWHRWSLLPGARYRRTDELRSRIDGPAGSRASAIGGNRLVWRHPQTQALLELENRRCRHLACRICPLAALDRSQPSAIGAANTD